MQAYLERALSAKWKSDAAKNQVTAILNHHEDYSRTSYGGRVLTGMLMAIGDIYPQDKATIATVVRRETRQSIATRGTGKPKVSDPNPKTGNIKLIGECDGCDDSNTPKFLTEKQRAEQDGRNPSLIKAHPKNGEEVLAFFEGQVNQMRMYAKVAGIKLGNRKEALKIADHIFDEMSKRGMFIDEEE